MTDAAVETTVFAQYVPLNGLKPESQRDLAKKSKILEAKAGTYLFKTGEHAAQALFIMSGEVQIEDNGKAVAKIAGGTSSAQHRVAHQTPRKVSAKCLSDVKYLAVDSSLLDVMLTWDQTGSFEVEELSSGDDDWMGKLLQIKTFQSVPPGNLQAMFMRMQQINVEPGQVIVKQGEEGDFFYVIMSGKCLVTREQPNSKAVRLAELDHGACFGEEALISDATRNASVTALTKGSLMRLSKLDFRNLLNDPLARKLSYAEANKMVEAGQAKWLDVRLPSEFQNSSLPGSINIPLYMLRMKLAALPKTTKWVVCCDTGRRSSVAVFVLTQKGYEAYLLDKGIPAAA